MDKAQGKSGVLETMEESKDKIPYDKAVWYSRVEGVVLCQDLVQHKMRNFNYFQLTNSDSLATLAL